MQGEGQSVKRAQDALVTARRPTSPWPSGRRLTGAANEDLFDTAHGGSTTSSTRTGRQARQSRLAASSGQRRPAPADDASNASAARPRARAIRLSFPEGHRVHLAKTPDDARHGGDSAALVGAAGSSPSPAIHSGATPARSRSRRAPLSVGTPSPVSRLGNRITVQSGSGSFGGGGGGGYPAGAGLRLV